MKPEIGKTNAQGMDFSYLTCGEGPLALLLHGFPDAPPTWTATLEAVAEAGYRAVAPWMRGYAPTDVPADGCYQTGVLAADANALHEALGGGEDAVLIGHDWGATATYPAVNDQPERWGSMIAMSVPHPSGMGSMFFDWDQIKRSFYMFVFQHPLAEMMVPFNDHAFIDSLWADWSPGLDPAVRSTATRHVKDALSAPENLIAALGYYRATLSGLGVRAEYDAIQAGGSAPITIPALYLHGRDDGCIGADLAEAARGGLTHERSCTVILDGAGHFMQLEQPDVVNGLIVDFLR